MSIQDLFIKLTFYYVLFCSHLMCPKAYSNAQIMSSHDFHHPGILGVGESNPIKLCWHLETKCSHFTQLSHDFRGDPLLSVITSWIIDFLKEEREKNKFNASFQSLLSISRIRLTIARIKKLYGSSARVGLRVKGRTIKKM